jgi:EmrB/QacA subfamily drug resistance transporter
LTSRRRRWAGTGLALAGPLIGIFAMATDASAANLALPGIQRDLDASTAELQWVAGAYMAAVAATVIAVSRAGDILGRRRVFAYGLVVFGAGSLACGLAPDPAVLIASRIVQGLGGGAVYSLSLAVITASRPRSEVGRGVAAWAIAAGLAMSVAPLLGGSLVSAFDWRAVFLVNVPVVLVALVLTTALLPESRDEEASRHVDLPGALALTAGLAMLMVGIIQAGAWGWSSPAVLGLIAAGVVAIGLFVAVELRSGDPLIDLRLFFGNLRFVAANGLAVPAYGAIYAVLFLVPLFLQNVQGHSPLEAGLHLLPFPVLFFVLSRPVGRMVARTGTLMPMLVGAGLMIAALLMLSAADAGSGEALLGVAFALLGAGQAFALIGISAAALATVPPGKAGAASGIRSTASYAGGALWVALAGAVLTIVERSSLADATDEQGRRLTTDELRDVEGLLSGSDAARAAASDLPPLDAEAVRAAAADAFVSGMSWALRLCAIVLAAAAVLTLWLYRRARGAETATAPPPEHSPLHPHPPAWATLRGRPFATEERA